MNEINNQIREKLFSMQDLKYKEFNTGILPGVDNMIGVRTPLLRKQAKEIIKGDWRKYLNHAEDKYYEELLLQGLVIGYVKADINEILDYLDIFIPKINNWGVCDLTVGSIKIVKENPKVFWEFIQKYLKSGKEYEIRFSIVSMLNYYINEEYIDKVLEELDKIKNEEYYVKMAVAWAISACYVNFKDKTVKYLDKCTLDDWTYNKAIQKAIESNQISDNEKAMLRGMKRR